MKYRLLAVLVLAEFIASSISNPESSFLASSTSDDMVIDFPVEAEAADCIAELEKHPLTSRVDLVFQPPTTFVALSCNFDRLQVSESLVPSENQEMEDTARLKPTYTAGRIKIRAEMGNAIADGFPGIAKLIPKAPVPTVEKEGTITLDQVAADPKLLESAWVSYDPDKKIWKATWTKPPVFHFGMLLLPGLNERFHAGDACKFECQGEMVVLRKNGQGKLEVERQGSTTPLAAKGLRQLLENKISSDGLSLFLDNGGNLVLQASGERALAMNQSQPNHP